MSKKYKISNKQGIYFLSFAVVNWIDVFTRRLYKDVLVDSLKYCQQEKGLVLYSWVIMSNHVHLIARAEQGNLSDILRDFKKYTSRKIIQSIEENAKESRREWLLRGFRKAGIKNSNNTTYQFWRQDNQPKEILPYQDSFGIQKLDYIHNNPVEAGIVEKAEEYLYSSARDYCGIKGLLEVELLE